MPSFNQLGASVPFVRGQLTRLVSNTAPAYDYVFVNEQLTDTAVQPWGFIYVSVITGDAGTRNPVIQVEPMFKNSHSFFCRDFAGFGLNIDLWVPVRSPVFSGSVRSYFYNPA